jgi:hypothetical protein
MDEKNYWVSWYGNHLGKFTVFTPWWISGWRVMSDGSDDPIFCAAIKASSEEQAKLKVAMAYDVSPGDNIEFRFVSERPEEWAPFSDRFPKADWMKWGA